MSTPPSPARFKFDPYIGMILGMVALASVLPCRGDAAVAMGHLTNAVIALLFFLYGARLSRDAVVAGMTHWRLQLLVFASTFVLFPLFGLGLSWLARDLLAAPLVLGLMFVSMLPSTIQSSIVFTSIGGGNVPAAVCSASLSNLLGIVITPMLVGLMLSSHGHGFSLHAVEAITRQLFLPFVAGQLLRPWIAGWMQRHRRVLGLVDRSSILLVVYTAFSESVVHGLWHQLGIGALLLVLGLDAVLLAAVLVSTTLLSRRLGFARSDEVSIVFCGSKKSLASGLPMANILFAGRSVGLIVLPLMLLHQIQLMACAVLAQRYARQAAQGAPGSAAMPEPSPRTADQGAG